MKCFDSKHRKVKMYHQATILTYDMKALGEKILIEVISS